MTTSTTFSFGPTSGTLLERLVVVHDGDVHDVEQHQNQRLVPLDPFVVDDTDEDGHRNAVRQAIPRQGPPIEGNYLQGIVIKNNQPTGTNPLLANCDCRRILATYHSGTDSTAGGHRQDVEDGGAHDGADADVALRNERSDHVHKQLGR